MDLIKGKSTLSDEFSFKLMSLYGIRVPEWDIVSTLDEAKSFCNKIGYPVVMKVSSDQPIHKTEIGGVIMNIDESNLESSFKTLISKMGKVMIQKQLSGVEVFLGGLNDASFGPSILTGPGGIYVEVLKSISYGLVPISENEALEMMTESKVLSLLQARKRNYDVDATIRAITGMSRMIEDLAIKEMDINPLIVTQDDAYAVDIRIVM